MEDICYICREENDYSSITLSCSHKYHFDCIKNSIKFTSPECPYCRLPLNINIVNNLLKNLKCKAICKSGKQCSHKILNNNDGYCGKHKKV